MTDVAQPFTVSNNPRLSVFNTVGATFQIFGRAPLFFLVIALIDAIPECLLLAFGEVEQKHTNVLLGNTFAIGILSSGLVATAMTYGTAQIERGDAASIGEALSFAVSRYLPMLGMMILYWPAVILGSVLLFVPGFILVTMFSLAVPACALEKLGPKESLTRSRVLTKGSRWRIFGIFVLFVGFIIALQYIASLLLHGSPLAVANIVVSVIYTPFGAIYPTLIYLHLCRLNEHAGVGAVFD